MLDELLFSGAFPSCPQPIDPPLKVALNNPHAAWAPLKRYFYLYRGESPRPPSNGTRSNGVIANKQQS